MESRWATAKRRTCSVANAMSAFTVSGTARARRSISSRPTTMSPVQWSSFAAYSRTASSPRASICASISEATACALPDSVSGVFPAFFRYVTAMARSLSLRIPLSCCGWRRP